MISSLLVAFIIQDLGTLSSVQFFRTRYLWGKRKDLGMNSIGSIPLFFKFHLISTVTLQSLLQVF